MPRANGNGSVSLLDSEGEPALVLPSPWMKDADGRVSTDLAVSLTPVGSDYQYVITPDPAWLASARYPVVVDPTVTYGIKRTYADRTAVVRKNAATTEYFPGLDYNGNSAGEYPAVGTTSAGDAHRTVIYVGSALPLDSDIDAATLHLEVDHVQYGGDVTLQAYDPHTDSVNVSQPGSGNVTWNSIGGTTPPTGVTTSPTYFFDFDVPPSFTINFDVTAIVQGWDDRRDDASSATQAIVIRDTSDSGTSPSGARYYFKSQNYSGYAWLSVTYTQGWYAFQGNRRHTGRTQYPVRSGIGSAWTQPLSLGPYPAGDYDPVMLAGVLAVPGTSNPIVYPTMTNGTYSAVYRIQDNGDGVTPTTTASRLLLGVAHATPLLYNGRLFVATLDPNFLTSYLYILDATTLQNAGTQGNPNPVQFTGPIYGSPVPNPKIPNSILIPANIANPNSETETGYDPFLLCRSTLTGLPVSAWNEATLDPLYALDIDPGGVHPHNPPVFFSSPAVTGTTAYVAANAGFLNGRSLLDGSEVFEPVLGWANDDGPGSSVSVLGDKVFYSVGLDPTEPHYPAVNGVFSDGTLHWSFDFYSSLWTTPAIRAEKTFDPFNDYQASVVIVADDGGVVKALPPEDEFHSGNILEFWTWETPAQDWHVEVPHNIRCSVLLAGAPGGSPYAFVAADNGHLYMLNASTGSLVQNFTMSGKVRSSCMAAAKGADGNARIYVLTLSGNLYCFH